MGEMLEKVKSIFGSKRKIEDIPESTRQEMLESLKWMDDFDLYSIDISELWEPYVSKNWDSVKFKEWVVKKDEIWNYVMIDGMKCREYRPWISWFVYEDIRSKYHFREWLKVWFCDKWKFKKSIIIDESFGPKKVGIMPEDISKELWWPFYEVNDINSIKKRPLHDIKWDDVFNEQHKENERIGKDEVNLRQDIFEKKDSEMSLKINWILFKKHTPWASGFIYKSFSDPYGEHSDYLLLAEYKDWKMVWEWIIVSSTKKIYVVTSNAKKEK